MEVRECKCGCSTFNVVTDDHVVTFQCTECDEVYFTDEVYDLETSFELEVMNAKVSRDANLDN